MTIPKNLGPRGRAFWRNIVERYELSALEVELAVEAARTLDLVERLHTEGGPLPELRQQRLALGRLLGQLAVPPEDVVDAPTTARARKAANARWARPALVAARRKAGAS
jgi:hypothetical protein